MNAERVARAEEALKAEGWPEEGKCAVVDLLSDLRHFCDANDLSYHELDRTAHHHYSAENYALHITALHTKG